MTTLQPLEISGDIELPALSPHGGKTWVSPALADALGQVLDAAFELAGADFGDIQLLDAAARPRTAVQRNFPDWWVDYWDTAAAANGACAAALAQGGPVVIEDIERSPLLAGTPALAILRNAEVRALLCMPMRGGSGQIFGTLAVHYRKPQAPPRASLAHIELLARHGGMLAEQARDAQCAGMNQRRFGALARAAADALVWVNADWTAARVLENRNFIADPGEPAGAAWRNCVAPGDQPESVAELNAAIGQRRPFEREHRVARADGSAGWAHTRALPLFDDHGELVEWLCMVGDITARKNMQHSPAGSEECMRRFIRHAPAAQAIFDRDMRFMAASERWLNEHGLYGQEWLGQAIGNLFPAMAQRCKPAIARAQAGEEAPVDEDRFVRCDGSEHWLRWTVLPWHGSDTMPDGVVILAEDISERKRVALQLADREKQYSSVIEVALDGFWIADMEGRVLDVNDAYLRRSGFSRAELLGKRIAELDAVESADMVRGHLDKVRRIGRDRFETLHRAKSGELWPLEISTSYWSTSQGERYFSFLHDLTEQARLKQESAERREQLETMMKKQVAAQTAAAIAHELNQPLVAVSAFSEVALAMLRSGVECRDKLCEVLERNVDQAQRAGQTLYELLGFLYMVDTEFAPLNINTIMVDVVNAIQHGDFGGFRTELELEHGLRPVLCNRMQIEKVIVNLVQNGADAMRAAGVTEASITIAVRTAAEHTMAQVSISDCGPGLTADQAQRIFEPFYSTKPKGMGLGLAISRALVEAHGGHLWAETGCAGGATFHFTLPFADD